MADKVSFCDFKCSICLEILIEPVELPCKHELCKRCFRHNVEEANLVCPVCRKRISSWARKCKREGTLVNQTRWSLIQKLFPKQCLKRLQGDSNDSDEESDVAPKRVLAKSGELRQEYENEMKQVLKEREKEEKASEELIKDLLEKEKDFQLKEEKRRKEDEEFAKRIAEDFNAKDMNLGESSETLQTSSKIQKTAKILKERNSARKRVNKTKGKAPKTSPAAAASYSLDKYFLSNSRKNRRDGCETRGKDNDYEIAKKLQKQFDQEAVVHLKREDYLLRRH